MGVYRFVLTTPSAQVEELGTMTLRDDKEAVAFGNLVVREMMEGLPRPAPQVMEVIAGKRTVARIGSDDVT
jgi:hypothetical protein